MKKSGRILSILMLVAMLLSALAPMGLMEEEIVEAPVEIEEALVAADEPAEEAEIEESYDVADEEEIEVVPAPELDDEELEEIVEDAQARAACKHQYATWDVDYDWDTCKYTKKDGATHYCTLYASTAELYCYECDKSLDKVTINKYVTFEEPHYVESGSHCYFCDGKVTTSCKHSHKELVTSLYTFGTDSKHTRSKITYDDDNWKLYYCPDCGMYGYLEDGDLDWDHAFWDETVLDMIGDLECVNESHTFKNGACTGCGYVKNGLPSSTVAPSKVTLNYTGTQNMVIGGTLNISATLTPSNATTTYTYTSSSTKVATVSSSGVVTAVGEGSAKITVKTANGKKATFKVKVTDPYKPTKVTLSGSSSAMTVGSTVKLTATLAPDGAKTTLTWSSSKDKVATVSSSGVVTAVGEGSAKITVKTANGKKATYSIKVTDPYKPEKVTLSGASSAMTVGSTMKLSAALTPNTAKATLTWSSSKTKVATVSSSGLVTAVGEGSVKITVKTHNGKKATYSIKVTDPYKPDKVTLSGSSTAMTVGSTMKLSATLTPNTAKTTLIWTSSKTTVATVSSSGVVTAVGEGSVKITVKTANGKKATYSIKVTDPYKPEKVSLSGSTSTLTVGDTLQLKATLTPSSAKTTYTWSSSKTKVATVSSSGLVTAVGEGSVKITVKTANGKKATYSIKVTKGASSTRVDLANAIGMKGSKFKSTYGLKTRKYDGYDIYYDADIESAGEYSDIADGNIHYIHLEEDTLKKYSAGGAYVGMTYTAADTALRAYGWKLDESRTWSDGSYSYDYEKGDVDISLGVTNKGIIYSISIGYVDPSWR